MNDEFVDDAADLGADRRRGVIRARNCRRPLIRETAPKMLADSMNLIQRVLRWQYRSLVDNANTEIGHLPSRNLLGE